MFVKGEPLPEPIFRMVLREGGYPGLFNEFDPLTRRVYIYTVVRPVPDHLII